MLRAGARPAQEERGARTEARAGQQRRARDVPAPGAHTRGAARALGRFVRASLSLLCVRATREFIDRRCFLFDRQEQVEQLAAEKLSVEEAAAEQAQTLRQLTEANTTLSARTLQLANEAAAAEEELRAVNAVSECKQEPRLALLEKINLVQTENGSLRQ